MLIFTQFAYVKLWISEVIFYKNSCNFHFSSNEFKLLSYLQWIKIFVLVKKNNKCWLTTMTSLAVKSLKQVDSTTEFWPHGDRSKFFICIMRGCIESETSKKATGPKAWVYDSCKTTGRASIFWSKFWIANLNVFTKENRKAGRQAGNTVFLPLARLQRRFRTNSCPGPVFAFSGTCLPQKICKN